MTFAPTPDGLTFTLTSTTIADIVATDGTNDSYEVLLTLTTSPTYLDSGDPDLLAAFAINFGSSTLDAATLVSGPAGIAWTEALIDDKVPGGSAKCNGEEAGSLCIEAVASAANNLTLDSEGTYNWLFRIDLGDTGFGDTTTLVAAIGTLKTTGPRGAPSYSFQAATLVTATAGSLALPPSGGGGEPTDPDVAPVPEPGSLLLMGSGLLLAASRMRRGKR